MAMASDARAWLEQELRGALGFSEVSDIAAYVVSSFKSKDEVAAYLVELLGIPSARAAAIGARLFPEAPAATSNASKRQQKQAKPSKVAAVASPLVARPVEVNSRLKPARNLHGGASKAAGGARSSHVTNCLRCGRIEHNGGRKCAFCEAPLRYEALPDGYDAGLGGFSAAAKARGVFEEPTEHKSDGDDGGVPTARVWRNPDLPKDAQELVERVAQQLARDAKKARAGDAAAAEGPILASRGRVVRDGDAYSVVMA